MTHATTELTSGRQRELPVPEGLPAGGIIDAEFTEMSQRQLRDYARLLYKYRWLALTSFVLVFGSGLLATLLTTRLYTATTRLQLARQSPIQLQLQENVLRVEENDRNVNGSSSFLSTQVATLKSRDLAERVLRTQGLAGEEAFLDPGSEHQGLLALTGRLSSLLRPRGWESERTARPDAEDTHPSDVHPQLIDRYMGYLSVQEVRGTDLVEVSFTTPSGSLSAFLAAAHTQAYMEASEEVRRANDVTAKNFLGRQLLETRAQVGKAEAALERFAAEHPNVAVNQEQKVVEQRIADVSQLLTRAEGTRVSLQTRYAVLTHPGSAAKSYFLDRPGVQKLHLALLDLRAQRATLAERLGPNHLQMQELHRNETELERQIAAEISQETTAVQARYEAVQLREEALRHKIASLEQAAIEQRGLGTRYETLKKDVEAARVLHESLVKQQVETAVTSELAPTNVRVVDRAEVPQHPSKPSVPLNVVLSLLAGCVVAGAAVFACDYFDGSVKSSEDVEGFLRLPTLGTIPNFALARRAYGRTLPADRAPTEAATPWSQQRALVIVNEPRSPAAEAFRSLRTALLFSAPVAPPKVILLTSTGASEGKTVTSVNLASSLAEAGFRVMLLDVDLRRPACHRELGLENTHGLSSFLAGQVELAGVVRSLDGPGISFVSAGPTPPNPAELVGSARMQSLLESLREEYDFVILDSPPVLAVTDAVVLGREADGVVLVVKGSDTPRELVRRARDQLLQARVHLLGAVINNVDMRWGDGMFYGRYYGAYYGPRAAPQDQVA